VCFIVNRAYIIIHTSNDYKNNMQTIICTEMCGSHGGEDAHGGPEGTPDTFYNLNLLESVCCNMEENKGRTQTEGVLNTKSLREYLGQTTRK
jgi:hypothetical protein